MIVSHKIKEYKIYQIKAQKIEYKPYKQKFVLYCSLLLKIIYFEEINTGIFKSLNI